MALKALKKVRFCCCYCCCTCKKTVSVELHPSINPLLSLTESLTDDKSSFSSSVPLSTSRQHECISPSRSRDDLSVMDRTRDTKLHSPPALECFIIPSFGEDPPSDVAVKLKLSGKMASKFLKGVGEDLDIIQQLIKEDENKQLYEVRFMCHFAQKKVEEFEKAISEAMKDLKVKTRKGLLIWYTGHGGPGKTGNWIFQDGSVKFEDIYRLYKQYFKGRYLYIVTDCCNSGCWVEDCARLLDQDGIKCCHDAKDQKIYIKVFAACLPNEPAYDKYYTQCKGVKLLLHRTDPSKTIKFAEHRRLHYQSSEEIQTTLGVDFTKSDSSMCLLGTNGKCTHHITWPKYVQCLIQRKSSRKYLV